MRFPKLIYDKAEWLARNNIDIKLRNASSNSEFYDLLREKIIEDIETVFEKNISLNKRKAALADVAIGMAQLKTAIYGDNVNMADVVSDRLKQVGGLSKRLVISSVGQANNDISEKDISMVKSYGEHNNYPYMPIAYNENGDPYLFVVGGHDAWDRVISSHKDSGAHNEALALLIGAVKEKHRSEKEKKD